MSRTGLCITVGLCLALWAGVGRAEPPAVAVRTQAVGFKRGELAFAGTLWLPSGGEVPRAGVVLLDDVWTKQRRTLEPYPEWLVRRGVAVLQFSRGEEPQGPGPSLSEQAEDALAAARVLREKVAVLKNGPVGLMGLGRGAWVAVQAAARSPEPAFLVLVSGGGGPVWKQEVHRLRNEGLRQGLSGPELVDLTEFLGTLYDARLYAPGNEARAQRTLDFQLKRAKRKRWYRVTPLRGLDTLTPEQLWESQRQAWRDVLSYDSTEDLGRVRCPVLALVGERDVLAPASTTAQALSAGMKQSPVPQGGAVTVRVVSGARSLIPASGKPSEAESVMPALNAMSGWLDAFSPQ